MKMSIVTPYENPLVNKIPHPRERLVLSGSLTLFALVLALTALTALCGLPALPLVPVVVPLRPRKVHGVRVEVRELVLGLGGVVLGRRLLGAHRGEAGHVRVLGRVLLPREVGPAHDKGGREEGAVAAGPRPHGSGEAAAHFQGVFLFKIFFFSFRGSGCGDDAVFDWFCFATSRPGREKIKFFRNILRVRLVVSDV